MDELFRKIVEFSWTDREIAELRSEAEWWEAHDMTGWAPGAGQCRCTPAPYDWEEDEEIEWP